MMVIFR